MKKIISLTLIVAMLNSCALVMVPNKQKNIQINTNSSEAKVYVENNYAGKGQSVTLPKITKNGFKNVVIKVGQQEKNFVMVPSKRDPIWWATLPIDICLVPLVYGIYHFMAFPKYWKYDKSYDFNANISVPEIQKNQKEINYLATKIEIKDKKNDLKIFDVKYNIDLFTEFEKAEEIQYQEELKAEAKKAKKKKNQGSESLIDEEDKTISYDDSYYSESIYKMLKSGGYIDTSGTVLRNKANILGLESTIKGAKIYNVTKKGSTTNLFMIKLDMTWLFVNSFGQAIDSMELQEFSDQFAFSRYYTTSNIQERDDNIKKAYQSAVNNSFLKLYESEKFEKYIKTESAPEQTNALLTLVKPKNVVATNKESLKASVIIKLSNNKGHGSGFAITQDGYIITNHHVIAGNVVGKYEDFRVIMPDGSEKKGTVIRSNPYYDVALIKVEDATFEKVFLLENEKNYEQLDEVYTVGAPISVQLGNSLSSGILSNERVYDGIELLQLNMAISPGNSGGALFNRETCKLVGVISSKVSGGKAEGIGFAIPSKNISNYLNIVLK